MADFLDDFSTALGSKYEGSNSAGYMPVISGGRLTGGSTATHDYLMRVAPSYIEFTPNQSVEWLFYSSSSTGTSQGGVLRSSGVDGSHNCYICRFYQYNKTFYIDKIIGGQWVDVQVNLASYIAATAATVGDILRCEIIADNTINFYRNDVLVVSHQDTTDPILTGQPGVFIRRNTSNTVMDDFHAIDLVSGVSGSSDTTLSSFSSELVGDIGVSGNSSIVLGGLSSESTGLSGSTGINGNSNSALSLLGSSALGSILLSGSSSPTLQALSKSSTGHVQLRGSNSTILGGINTSYTGDIVISGESTKILNVTSQVFTGTVTTLVISTGQSNTSFSEISFLSTGGVRNRIIFSPDEISAMLELMNIPTPQEVATAVWSSAEALLVKDTSAFTMKVLVNKREIKQIGSVWNLIVYDDDGTTPILQKELKDISGQNISNLISGVLAMEEMSSV